MSNNYATPSSPLYSEYKNSIDEILSQLPNNTSNMIDAQDIRDAIWTIWTNLSNIENITNTISTSSILYQNDNEILIDMGGIKRGMSFSNPKTVKEMWDTLLYPYIPPTITLSRYNHTDGKLEYGNPLSGVNRPKIQWNAVRNSNDLQTLIFHTGPNNHTITTGTGSTSGIYTINNPFNNGFTYSSSPSYTTLNVITVSLYDINGTFSISTITYSWMNKIYWGRISLPIRVDLNINPGSASLVNITDSMILSLDGAGANNLAIGSELSTSKSKIYKNINGNGDYLIFAWASNLPDAHNPTFIVNGMLNTAFTRIRTNSPFTNQYGFVTNYEVWISNTPQNSPLNIEII